MNRSSVIVRVQSLLVALMGISLLSQPIINFISVHFHRFALGHRGAIASGPHLLATVIGISLLFFVFYLYKRRQVAYFGTTALLLCTLTLQLTARPRILTIVFLIGLLGWMGVSHAYYKAKSDLVSLASGVRIALAMAVIGYVYGVLGFFFLSRGAFHDHVTLNQAAGLSFRTLFTLQDVSTPTGIADAFVRSLNVVGFLLFFLIASSLFKPVQFVFMSTREDKKKALAILRAKSRSSEDYFKLWPDDKHYYFSESGKSFLAYKMSGRTAIILGDPSGVVAEFAGLIASYNDFVQSNGWIVASINATAASRRLYKQIGLHELFIGNEAILSIPDYATETVRSKHFRYVHNKAKRDQLTVEEWDSPSDEQIAVLRRISDAWLSRNGRKEYTFFMGYFDADYLQRSRVMVLRQEGEVVAYVNVLPSFIETEASIDHLRTASGASPVAMHYLLSELILKLHQQGKQRLNLGFAPLSGIEQRKTKPLGIEHLLGLVKKLGARYYSFQGLEQFKGKFQPDWQPRYLYYSASVSTVLRDIEQASQPSYDTLQRRRVIAAAVGIVALFILVQFI